MKNISSILNGDMNSGFRAYLNANRFNTLNNRRSYNAVGNSTSSIITHDALHQMAIGNIPDVRTLCNDLYDAILKSTQANALAFIPVLQEMEEISPIRLNMFIRSKTEKHVLVDNDLMKVVLIHWPSGSISSIHGHPKGGCVFKVLSGSLEEIRYTKDDSPKLLSVSAMHKDAVGYIDDTIGYHAVGNPNVTPAISIHVYTHGK